MNRSQRHQLSRLSLDELTFLRYLSRKHGVPVQKLLEQLRRNRVEAEMVAAVEGITTEDFYLRRIAQIKTRLEEFQ